MSDYTQEFCNTCGKVTVWRYGDDETPNDVRECAEHDVPQYLEYLRGELRAQRISYGELSDLQGLGAAGLIDPGDVELLEAAGVPEFPEEPIRHTFTVGIPNLGDRDTERVDWAVSILREIAGVKVTGWCDGDEAEQ